MDRILRNSERSGNSFENLKFRLRTGMISEKKVKAAAALGDKYCLSIFPQGSVSSSDIIDLIDQEQCLDFGLYLAKLVLNTKDWSVPKSIAQNAFDDAISLDKKGEEGFRRTLHNMAWVICGNFPENKKIRSILDFIWFLATEEENEELAIGRIQDMLKHTAEGMGISEKEILIKHLLK